MSSSRGVGMNDKMYLINRETVTSFSNLPDTESAFQTTEIEGSFREVLNTVDVLSEEINQIEELITKIATNHNAIMSSFQNEAAMNDNEKLHDEVKRLSHHVSDELKRMKRDLDDEASGSDRHSADYRIRRAQHNTLSRRFRDVMMRLNAEEEDYREKNKDKIQRQLKIAKQNVSEEKLEEILEQKNPQLLVQNILGDASVMQHQRMLSEVQARHQEILRLEENIRDLHDMFYDLSQLVYDQGELINQIEYNVEKSAGYVEKGRVQARIAADYKKSNAHLKWIICCVVSCVASVILIIIIIVIAVIAYFLRNT